MRVAAWRAVGVGAAMALVLAACGDDGGGGLASTADGGAGVSDAAGTGDAATGDEGDAGLGDDVLAPGDVEGDSDAVAGIEAGADAGEDVAVDAAGPDAGPEDVSGDVAEDVSGDVAEDASEDVPCVPDCAGKQCGDDGCGGSCGLCETGTECVPEVFECWEPQPPCVEASSELPALGYVGVATPPGLGEATVRVRNCGLTPAIVTGAALEAGSAAGFGGPSLSEGATWPVVLGAGELVDVFVPYVPLVASPLDGGALVPDVATIALGVEELEAPVTVEVEGLGSDGSCMLAAFEVAGAAAPFESVSLDANVSAPTPGDGLLETSWVVQAPATAPEVVLVPNASLPTPSFTPVVAGEYTVRLTAADSGGAASCAAYTRTVEVVPVDALHLELTWVTPADADPSDNVGVDLDVHLVHPNADGGDVDGDGVNDGWFDLLWDCYWWEPAPTEWGSADPDVADDPSLALEDTDGEGPEIARMPVGEAGLSYQVGVHAWNASGFGASTATLRIYVGGELVAEPTLELVEGDLWHVGTVSFGVDGVGTFAPMTAEGGGAVVFPGVGEDVVPL